MNFLVIGHVIHTFKDGKFFAYGPYVREMNLWAEYVDQLTLLVPFDVNRSPDPIDLPYSHPKVTLEEVPSFNLTSGSELVKAIVNFPVLWIKTWKAMKKADHIHLRCPGNMGLLGALVQVFFSEKVKSTKYAGNWDRSASKPFTYRIQQDILANSTLSKKMQVLVYGEWKGESENIRPFFTASYSENEIQPLNPKVLDRGGLINLIFAGGLVEGKQPMISAKVAGKLIQSGLNVRLDFYGEGPERIRLESFIREEGLSEAIFLHGNVPADELKEAYKKAHFLIFISESEGWPKVVAEAMFWGCVPVTTAVSCVPQMLGYGERGDLVKSDVFEIHNTIESYFENPALFDEKGKKAAKWSREFTLERFREEIKHVLIDR